MLSLELVSDSCCDDYYFYYQYIVTDVIIKI